MPSPPGGGDRWWWGEDSNLRRLSRQIYSLIPLTTREPHRRRSRPFSRARPSMSTEEAAGSGQSHLDRICRLRRSKPSAGRRKRPSNRLVRPTSALRSRKSTPANGSLAITTHRESQMRLPCRRIGTNRPSRLRQPRGIAPGRSNPLIQKQFRGSPRSRAPVLAMNPARRSKTAPSGRRGRRASLGRPAAGGVLRGAGSRGSFRAPAAGGGGRAAPAVPWPAVPPCYAEVS